MKRIVRFEMVMDEDRFRMIMGDDAKGDKDGGITVEACAALVCNNHSPEDGYVRWWLTDKSPRYCSIGKI